MLWRFATLGGLVYGPRCQFVGAGLAAGLLALAAPAAAMPAQCAQAKHPGGEWTSLNHDLSNTRFQDQERSIGAANAGTLTPAWAFKVPSDTGSEGGIQSTPIVANGCVYFTTSDLIFDPSGDGAASDDQVFRGGHIFALNADTGELVWRTKVNGFALGLTEDGGRLYALPTGAPAADDPAGFPEPQGSHAIALDAGTGRILWTSPRLDAEPKDGSAIEASPVLFRPTRQPAGPGAGRALLFVPLSVAGGDGARVPLYFLDARDGTIVKKFHALSEADYAAGYGGSGIWSTAAFDADTNHLYAGTADSEGHTQQHPYNNAILKIDADPTRSTFGSVVDAYQGTSEHYDLDRQSFEWENNVVCETDSTAVPNVDVSQSTACLELDLDFGGSPNPFVDAQGRKLVTELQKSGVLHAVSTEGMDAAWTKVMSGPTEASNGSTAATEGTNLFVSTFPNVVSSFERTAGTPNWMSTTGITALGYQPVTTANGVVYTISDGGELLAHDGGTGQLLLRRGISIDSGVASCFGTGAGVAIARETVYAPCDAGAFILTGTSGALVAYRRE